MTSINGQAPLPFSSAQTQQKQSLDQLASGRRVSKASDDAASLAIASRIGSDNVTLGQAAITASTGQALLATADSGLSAVSGVLGQLQTLAAAAQSGILSASDRANLNTQYTSLLGELDNSAAATQFNGQSLLDGSYSSSFQLGSSSSDTVNVQLNGADSATLGLSGTDLSTAANASAALDAITAATATVTADRAEVGATSGTFAARSTLIGSSQEADRASLSALTDADAGNASKQQSISDALSQANIAALVKKQHNSEHLLALLQ